MSTQVAGQADAATTIRLWVAQELFEQVPMSICVLDRDLRVAACNKNFAAVFGDPAGKTCYQAYKKSEDACESCAVHKTFRDGVSRISEACGVDCIGQRADYMVHHSPVYDDVGLISFVVNMSYDITDRKSVQSQYNLLFDRVPCSLSVISRDLRIIRANEHARARFGEVVGTRCFQTYKQQPKACEECPARRTFADGHVHTSQEVRRAPGGGCSYHLMSTAPIAEDRNGVTHVVEMSLDVTEVHELSEELERQRHIRHDITENSLDALVAVDAEGRVTIFNAAAEALFGRERSDVLQHEVGADLLPAAFFEAVRGGKRSLLIQETHVLTRNGDRVPVRLSGTVLRMGEQVVGGAAFLQDLRERQELERQNLRNERMAAVGHTVTQLAHSIKNILTGIQGGIYDIKKGCERNDVPRRDEGLDTLDRNFARIHTMVRDFLRLSKDHELEIASCDANDVARDVYTLFRPLAEKHGMALCFEPWPSLLPVQLDAEAMHTCLSNLVSNALEACLNVGEPCQGGITVGCSEGVLRYEVWDTGCGMTGDVMAKLFHSIFTTKGSAGTGLGLMMTKKIVEDHGGKLRVRSRPGHGARFTVELPVHDGSATGAGAPAGALAGGNKEDEP